MRNRFIPLLAITLLVPALAPAAEISVTMAGSNFQPAEISATVGDTVRLINDDTELHDVFVPTAGFATNLGNQEAGTEAVLVLGKAGTFEVECVYHAHMLIEVEVK